MKKENVISIVGVNHGDIAYYLSKLLGTCNEPVLCLDMSRYGEIFNTIKKLEGANEVYVKNLTYAYNTKYVEKGVYDKFRYIVIYHGHDIDAEWFNNSGHKIIISDFDKYHIARLKEELEKVEKKELYLALTDHYSKKVSVDKLIQLLGIEKEEILDSFEIPYEFEDKATFISWMHNGAQKISGLTKDMRAELKNIYFTVVGKEGKANFSKIVKMAG